MSISPDLDLSHLSLPNDEVHIWTADLRLAQTQTTSLHGLLDADEQQRAARFKVSGAREQFVLSHAFLRLVLSRYLQIEPANVRYRLAAKGKPELVDGENIKFNLSHTEGTAALAITRGRAVGIDVERIREDVEAMELADRFFSRAEVESLRSEPISERLRAFFAIWTAKEALLKGWGTGFSTSLAAFAVLPKPEDARVQLEILEGHLPRDWSISQLNLGPDLRAAVAVQGRGDIVRCGRWVWR